MATRYIIPIVPETLDMITEMNAGVRPEIQEETTFFVWNGFLEPADIISVETRQMFWEELDSWKAWTIHAQTD